jgi:hypothetical protein
MATTEYERGFISGLEFGRMAALISYVAVDDVAWELRDHLNNTLLAAMSEAERDPAALRRRLLAAFLQCAPAEPTDPTAPPPSAEVISLAERRKASQRDRHNHESAFAIPA